MLESGKQLKQNIYQNKMPKIWSKLAGNEIK